MMKAVKQWWYEVRWDYCIKHKQDMIEDIFVVLFGKYCQTCKDEEWSKERFKDNCKEQRKNQKRNKAITKLGVKRWKNNRWILL